jgi:hypothetical protein
LSIITSATKKGGQAMGAGVGKYCVKVARLRPKWYTACADLSLYELEMFTEAEATFLF